MMTHRCTSPHAGPLSAGEKRKVQSAKSESARSDRDTPPYKGESAGHTPHIPGCTAGLKPPGCTGCPACTHGPGTPAPRWDNKWFSVREAVSSGR